MAIDSREQRASLISWARAWAPMLPLPDVVVSEGDRQQLAWFYRSADLVLLEFCVKSLTITDLTPTLIIASTAPTLAISDTAPTLRITNTEPVLAIIDAELTLKVTNC